MTNKQKQNLNELKRELFKGLEEKVKITSKNLRTITFMRKMNFGKTPVYFEYSFEDKAINKIYSSSKGKKRVYYSGQQAIPNPQELNKYFEK